GAGQFRLPSRRRNHCADGDRHGDPCSAGRLGPPGTARDGRAARTRRDWHPTPGRVGAAWLAQDWHVDEDTWSAGDRYEPYVGRWSRPVGERFVAWIAPRAHGRWLDVGCGTGALTETVLMAGSPASVTGVDPSP